MSDGKAWKEAELTVFHLLHFLGSHKLACVENCTGSITLAIPQAFETFSKVSFYCHWGLFASLISCGVHHRSVWQANLISLQTQFKSAFTTLSSVVMYALNVDLHSSVSLEFLRQLDDTFSNFWHISQRWHHPAAPVAYENLKQSETLPSDASIGL